MDCYKLIITEERFNTSSSNLVLIKLLNEIFPGQHKPEDEIAFAYKETSSFPKEYYFNTSNADYLERIRSLFTVIEADYPATSAETDDFLYYGNRNLLPVTL